MKVKDLIEALSQFPDDMVVGFSHPSHDYWRTQLFASVASVGEGQVTYSSYHSQDKIVEYDAERNISQDSDKLRDVLILEG